MALFVIMNYRKQKQNKKRIALFVIMNYSKQRARTKTYGTVCYLKNECKQRAKQKTHVTLFVIMNYGKQRAKQKNTCETVCYRERMSTNSKTKRTWHCLLS
jgi:hypothetical protein